MSSLLGYVDKRRKPSDTKARGPVGATFFTTNAVGTTTTAVGANAAPATETNVVRIGDRFKLYTSADVLKEETVFEVTAVAVAASTTVTFTPAAAAATASGDKLREVTVEDLVDEAAMDARLTALDSGYFTAARLRQMSSNDKLYAIRVRSDPASL